MHQQQRTMDDKPACQFSLWAITAFHGAHPTRRREASGAGQLHTEKWKSQRIPDGRHARRKTADRWTKKRAWSLHGGTRFQDLVPERLEAYASVRVTGRLFKSNPAIPGLPYGVS